MEQNNQFDGSIFVDQGEYFFDEEFVVPFDNEITSNIFEHNCLTRCYSDSKLNKNNNYYLDSNYGNLLFSTNGGGNNAGDVDYNTISSNGQASHTEKNEELLTSSLVRRFSERSFKNDYKIAYGNGDSRYNCGNNDAFIPISSLKALDRALDKVIEAIPNKGNVMKRSVGISTSIFSNTGTNTTTWARVKGSKESLNRVSQKDVDLKKALVMNDKQSWQVVKNAASKGLTTWGQLKRVARNSRNDKKDSDKMITSQQFCDNTSNLNQMCKHNLRSQSQPSNLSAKEMQRFSGTLLEIYMRARLMDNSTMDYRNTPIMTNSAHQKPFPPSPSMQEIAENLKDKRPKGWFDNLLSTNAISALSNCEEDRNENQTMKQNDPKSFLNFGAQFPPMNYVERAKLSTLGFLHHQNPANRRPLSSAFPQFPLRVKNQQFQQIDTRRRSLSSMNSQVRVTSRTNSSHDQPVSGLHNIGSVEKPVICQNIPPLIEYPGLGPLTIPKPSRLIEAAFLSVTLPDLSFLTQAAAEEELNNQQLISKNYSSRQMKNNNIPSHSCVCEKCGHRARTIKANKKLAQMKNPRRHNNPSNQENNSKDDLIDRSTSEPDIILGHLNGLGAVGKRKIDPQKIMTISAITTNTDRDKADALLRYTKCDLAQTDTTDDTATTTTSGADFLDADNNFISLCRRNNESRKSKKSVTFTGNRLKNGSSLPEKEALVTAGIKVIPRNWGLYGGDPGPLAEFSSEKQEKEIKTIKAANKSANVILLSANGPKNDIDVRYHALVNDVIRAVQVTVAFFSNIEQSNQYRASGKSDGLKPILDPTPQSSSTLLAVVNPLLILLNDGLLTPARNLFGTKNRSRLWNLIEDSCRPSSCPAGVAQHVLTEAINEVKGISNANTNDKIKFKAFIISCLKLKALPMWLNAVVGNEPLLRRYYCDGSFIRQCRTTQRGLYADLMTHLEQLLVYTFDLQLEIEIKKPASTSINATNSTNSQNSPTNNLTKTPQRSLMNGYSNNGTANNSANNSTASSINTNISLNSTKSANFMQATAASINRQNSAAKTNLPDTNNNKVKSYRSITNYSQQNPPSVAKKNHGITIPQRPPTVKPLSENSSIHLPQLRRTQSPVTAYKTQTMNNFNRKPASVTSKGSIQLKSEADSRVTFATDRTGSPSNSSIYSRIKADTPPPLPPHLNQLSGHAKISSQTFQTVYCPMNPKTSPITSAARTKFNKPSFLQFRRSNSHENSSEKKQQDFNAYRDSRAFDSYLPPSGIPRPSPSNLQTARNGRY